MPPVQMDAGEVFCKQPERQLAWLQKALGYAAAMGKLEVTTVFDIITHRRFMDDMRADVARHGKELLMANLQLFSVKQQHILQEKLVKLSISSDDLGTARDPESFRQELVALEESPQQQVLTPAEELRAILMGCDPALRAEKATAAARRSHSRSCHTSRSRSIVGSRSRSIGSRSRSIGSRSRSIQRSRSPHRSGDTGRNASGSAETAELPQAVAPPTAVRTTIPNAAVAAVASAAKAAAIAAAEAAAAAEVAKTSAAEAAASALAVAAVAAPSSERGRSADPALLRRQQVPVTAGGGHEAQPLLPQRSARSRSRSVNHGIALGVSRSPSGRRRAPPSQGLSFVPTGTAATPPRSGRRSVSRRASPTREKQMRTKRKSSSASSSSASRKSSPLRKRKEKERSKSCRRPNRWAEDSSPAGHSAGVFSSSQLDDEARRVAKLAAAQRQQVTAGIAPLDVRSGDWFCTICGAHNYASKSQCFRCVRAPQPQAAAFAAQAGHAVAAAMPPTGLVLAGGSGKPGRPQAAPSQQDALRAAQVSAARRLASVPSPAAPVRSGDWFCSICNAHNFASKPRCFRCFQGANPRLGGGML